MTTRRLFLKSGALLLATTGAFASIVTAAAPAAARRRRPASRRTARGFAELIADPDGIIDLPRGFRYCVFSSAGEPLSDGGVVPSYHDGMAAFPSSRGTWLVRNHELDPQLVEEEGLFAVPVDTAATYDPEGAGGTTTLLVGPDRELLDHRVSLAGTTLNCAGGPTPWGTWLTCEESDADLALPHGYVFEVDPRRGGNPQPIVAMGRFEHEAVAFDAEGRAYLTEDASLPLGCIYRFTPQRPREGRGSLHAGGLLEAMCVEGIDSDLSVVQQPGTRLRVQWLRVPAPNPARGETRVREQVIALGATPLRKAEGTGTGVDGCIWFVSSFADGPLAQEPKDITAAAHAGQIWRYDPNHSCIELVAILPAGSPYDGPDNITASPHGFAVACTDGDEDNWLLTIGDDGSVQPFARNAGASSEFAGATFSPDGETLFVNLQEPGSTLAIWGPWQS